ncbi:MAG: hypothetical protein K0Q59_3445 [Paenibacillus sp.]|jgi:phage shock protein PspC (stress-responsive transcriptional regulator)|nr:hypothetical protein [Paenibacillus sp.]
MVEMKKLYRSERDKKLFGVCGGVAEMLNIDSTLLRVLFVVTIFFSGGILIPIYIVAALVIPKQPPIDSPLMSGWGYGAGPHSYTNSHGSYRHSSATGYGTASQTNPDQAAHIDRVMKDIESKAMMNEIQELKAKLFKYESKYEKGEV